MQQNEYAISEQIPANERIVNADPREGAGRYSTYNGLQPQPRGRSPWRPVVLCLIALALAAGILGLTGGLSFNSVSTQKALPTRSFTVNGHGSLVINDDSATFRIHEGTTNQVIVRGSESTFGLVNNLDGLQIQYSQNGNTILMNVNEGWSVIGNHEVDFDITVPANLDVTIHGSSTDVSMTNIDGRIDASSSSGNMHLNDVNGPLNLSTASGDITVSGEQGAVSAHTSSGDIRLSQLNGPVDLSTSSGNITLDQARISGQNHLQTTSGNIQFNGILDPRGTYRMETSSGNITLNLPADSSFQLTTSTDSGDVSDDFSSSTTGRAPHAVLALQTTSGDIHVQKH